MTPTHTILGIPVYRQTKRELISEIESIVVKTTPDSHLYHIVTLNPEIAVAANRNKTYREIVKSACTVVPDGIGIVWAGMILGKRFKERITGFDLVHELSVLAAQKHLRVGFLGGKASSAEKTKKTLACHHSHLIAWAEQGPLLPDSESFSEIKASLHAWSETASGKKIINLIHQTDMLFVAFGAPKQEYAIHWIGNLPEFANRTRPLVAIGVGGAFDEIAGLVVPTPDMIGRVGLKWLFRLIIQPWRIRRQLRLVTFVKLIVGEKFQIPNSK